MEICSPGSTVGERHSPLNRMVVDALRDRIVSGVLAAGERLVEGRLSQELGVSRVPVREALRQLAAEGLVTIAPRRGASVAHLEEDQVRELVEVRATLEALNAKLAAKRRDSRIAQLQSILDEGAALAEAGDARALMRLNERFHESLAKIAANGVLREMMRRLRDRTALLFTASNRDRVRQGWEEHSSILHAVIAGDAELAALLATRHVYNSAQLQPRE